MSSGTIEKNGLDQCPSSKKEGLPVEKPLMARDVSAASGKAFWRSLDEVAGTKEFREFLHREFPAHASELLDGSRRHFLKIMGASLALAGAAALPGCRRPDLRILAYNKQPEGMVIGKPLYYATAMPLPGGGCEGLLAETFEGRPIKVEGNPLHPGNQGKSSVWSQASVLDLYDPDRDIGGFDWKKFEEMSGAHFGAYDATKGQGLAFLVEKATSPTRDRLRDKVMRRWPSAKWYAYEPVDNEGAMEGLRIAMGAPMRETTDLSKAKVILALDRDFLGGECATLSDSRGFGQGRYKGGTRPGHAAADSQMSRLYVIESMMTLTGGQADHREGVKPSRVGAVAAAIAAATLSKIGSSQASAYQRLAASLAGDDLPDAKWIDALAEDLAANRGASAILVGPSQPAAVHAVACMLNSALGNIGTTVRYMPVTGDVAQSSLASIKSLAEEIGRGGVDTLVTIGCNPNYDAPTDLNFAEKYATIKHTIHLGWPCETGAASKIRLARSHYLEGWSDVESWEGVYTVVQPQIEPLFHSGNELALLSIILGEKETDPYAQVRETVRQRVGASGSFEKTWRRTLHDGMLAGSAPEAPSRSVNEGAVASAMTDASRTMGSSDELEVLFLPSPHNYDGRWANNGWLQELPHPVSKVCWDNPALIHPATARKLGISTNRHPITPQYTHGQVATVSVAGKSMDIAMWPQPGMAEGVVVMHLGYGRKNAGRVGDGTGFNTYALRSTGAMRFGRGASAAPIADASPYLLACTQDHWVMEGRDILREVDLGAWQKYGDEDIAHDQAIQKDSYGNDRGINFAGRLGMESHAPANKDVYLEWQKQAPGLRFTEVDAEGKPLRDARGNIIGRKNIYGRPIQQWGISIDLTKCSGCGACTIACQAENNIPIVGKMEVAKGREMHWIRVDRYYASNPAALPGVGGDSDIKEHPEMFVQPLPCLHCESAPCEVVCPVNATVHDPEGLNDMAYNRCIGTRYCSNNCPYKVRRFNFFDYATKQYHGTYTGEEEIEKLPEVLQPPSEYFIPPRFRQKKLEVATMQSNPHVTVRSRGVMEKCTFCIQRINSARVESKVAGLEIIPDGFFQTACQQACPTDAIVFGDIYDNDSHDGAGSMVKGKRNDPRTYALLDYLNTRPRTTFMVRLRNPNPKIRTPNLDPFHHGGGGGHEHGDGHEKEQGGHAMGRILSLPVLSGNGAMA